MNSPIHKLIEYLRNYGLGYNDTYTITYNRMHKVLWVLGYTCIDDYNNLLHNLNHSSKEDIKTITNEIIDQYKEVRDNE